MQSLPNRNVKSYLMTPVGSPLEFSMLLKVPPPQMPSSSPIPVPSTTANLPSTGIRLPGQGTPGSQRDLSATTWLIFEKLPLSPSNLPKKLPAFIWNASCSTTSSLTTVCRVTIVPTSDPVKELTAYRERIKRSP